MLFYSLSSSRSILNWKQDMINAHILFNLSQAPSLRTWFYLYLSCVIILDLDSRRKNTPIVNYKWIIKSWSVWIRILNCQFSVDICLFWKALNAIFLCNWICRYSDFIFSMNLNMNCPFDCPANQIKTRGTYFTVSFQWNLLEALRSCLFGFLFGGWYSGSVFAQRKCIRIYL